MRLADKIRDCDIKTIAKVISSIENRVPAADGILNGLARYTGSAIRVGLTGPPGVGKSTLVTKIAASLVGEKNSVAILAVDPTSPFTGGALLGDRVRMAELEGKVFIRSMATRGALGGIAGATMDAADVLDAAGHDYILVETVGVGQQEIEVSRYTDCVALVVSPESGDSVQMLKAGILEVADIIVVNKADRPNADKIVMDIDNSLKLTHKAGIRVMKTVASSGNGVGGLLDEVREFIAACRADGRFEKRRDAVMANRIRRACHERLTRGFQGFDGLGERLEESVKAVRKGRKGLYNEVNRILEEYYGSGRRQD